MHVVIGAHGEVIHHTFEETFAEVREELRRLLVAAATEAGL